jgi:hypothetical protein
VSAGGTRGSPCGISINPAAADPVLPAAKPESSRKRDTPAGVSLFLERLMGVEPTYAAWEAAVLPMNYSRVNGVYYNSSFWKKQDEN